MKTVVFAALALAAAVASAQGPLTPAQTLDRRTDPIGLSQQFYHGLKRYGVDADLVLYPREPHGLREEQHLLDRLTRVVASYDKYLKGAAASTVPQP